MNREQIENMPAGREMDRLIAKHIFPGDYLPYDLGMFPHYSTVIQDAWKIVSHFKSKGEHYEISHHINDVNLSYVAFGGEYEHYEGWGPVVDAVAESVPLAICRAALLTKVET